MKYKIYLDTNQLQTDNKSLDLFNENVITLRKFLKDNNQNNNISVCIPKIVFLERLKQKLDHVNDCIINVNSNIKMLRNLGHNIKEVSKKKNYKKNLELSARKVLKTNDITIVPIPKIESDILIERAIHKIKPFKNSDTGFKDSLIFFTLLNDAIKTNYTTFILCTGNYRDFNDEVIKEFNLRTKKELIIVSDITNLQSKLDEIIPLGLKLKEIYSEIEENIKKKTGTLMAEVNRKINKNSYDNSISLTLGASTDLTTSIFQNPRVVSDIVDINSLSLGNSVGGSSDEEKLVGYDFSDISFFNIQELDDQLYQVSVVLTVLPIHKGEGRSNNLLGYSLSNFSSRGFKQNFKILLNYKKNTGDIIIQSCRKDYFILS